MKKILILFMLCLLIVSGFSCNVEPYQEEKTSIPDTSTSLQQIYEIDTGTYGSDMISNQSNIIRDDVVYSIEKNVVATQKYWILDKQQELNYKETLYYVIGGRKVHKYEMQSETGGTVLFQENGELHAILNSPITKIDLSACLSEDALNATLQSVLGELVDFSKYEHVKVRGFEDDGSYMKVTYYNMLQGCYTDYVTMGIRPDGTITGLWITGVDIGNVNWIIDETLMHDAITLKLNALYAATESQYIGFDIMQGYSYITRYNNELYIECVVSAKFKKTSLNEELSEARRLLIPIDLVKEKI